jgi:hypothetical protein
MLCARNSCCCSGCRHDRNHKQPQPERQLRVRGTRATHTKPLPAQQTHNATLPRVGVHWHMLPHHTRHKGTRDTRPRCVAAQPPTTTAEAACCHGPPHAAPVAACCTPRATRNTTPTARPYYPPARCGAPPPFSLLAHLLSEAADQAPRGRGASWSQHAPNGGQHTASARAWRPSATAPQQRPRHAHTWLASSAWRPHAPAQAQLTAQTWPLSQQPFCCCV